MDSKIKTIKKAGIHIIRALSYAHDEVFISFSFSFYFLFFIFYFLLIFSSLDCLGKL